MTDSNATPKPKADRGGFSKNLAVMISKKQYRLIDEERKERDVSKAEVVRDALDLYFSDGGHSRSDLL